MFRGSTALPHSCSRACGHGAWILSHGECVRRDPTFYSPLRPPPHLSRSRRAPRRTSLTQNAAMHPLGSHYLFLQPLSYHGCARGHGQMTSRNSSGRSRRSLPPDEMGAVPTQARQAPGEERANEGESGRGVERAECDAGHRFSTPSVPLYSSAPFPACSVVHCLFVSHPTASTRSTAWAFTRKCQVRRHRTDTAEISITS